MGQHYSDPSRESDPYTLPNIETWEDGGGACDAYGEPVEPGWYYHFCLPGCLPDGDPVGPFETEEDALADAREGIES